MIFFDAFPVKEATISVDIMNPHYSNYYSGKEAPVDYNNPVPIHFLVVENTKFEFHIGIRKSQNDKEEVLVKEILQPAEKFLEESLKMVGIGAKTSAGYGRMIR